MLKLTRAPLCEKLEGRSCALFLTPTQGLKYVMQLWKCSGLAQCRPLLGLKGHSGGVVHCCSKLTDSFARNENPHLHFWPKSEKSLSVWIPGEMIAEFF